VVAAAASTASTAASRSRCVEDRVVAGGQGLRAPQADRVDGVVGVGRADHDVIDPGRDHPRIGADGVDVAQEEADRIE
jgi:hypothetical protein